MINADRRVQEKFCNCKNSKCMKLYCDCFSARVPCGKNCRCVGCQNTTLREAYQEKFYLDKRLSREELIRMHKGCACRRSNCTKKYCDCFQSGILCKQTCKCVDCQNNESLTNRKVIEQLRNKNSQLSSNQNSINLYSLYISQNSEHLQSIISESNPLRLEEVWLEECARVLYDQAVNGDQASVMEKFLQILIDLQNKMGEQITYKQEFSDDVDEERYAGDDKRIKNEENVDDYGSVHKHQEDEEGENQKSNMQQQYSIQEADRMDQDQNDNSHIKHEPKSPQSKNGKDDREVPDNQSKK